MKISRVLLFCVLTLCQMGYYQTIAQTCSPGPGLAHWSFDNASDEQIDNSSGIPSSGGENCVGKLLKRTDGGSNSTYVSTVGNIDSDYGPVCGGTKSICTGTWDKAAAFERYISITTTFAKGIKGKLSGLTFCEMTLARTKSGGGFNTNNMPEYYRVRLRRRVNGGSWSVVWTGSQKSTTKRDWSGSSSNPVPPSSWGNYNSNTDGMPLQTTDGTATVDYEFQISAYQTANSSSAQEIWDIDEVDVAGCCESLPCTPTSELVSWNFDNASDEQIDNSSGIPANGGNYSGCATVLLKRTDGGSNSTYVNNSSSGDYGPVCSSSKSVCTGTWDKATAFERFITVRATFPAGKASRLYGISFCEMSMNKTKSGGGFVTNNQPENYRVRLLRNGTVVWTGSVKPTTKTTWASATSTPPTGWGNYNASTDGFPVQSTNGSAQVIYEFQISAYQSSASSSAQEIWDLDEVKIFGCCDDACVTPAKPVGMDGARCGPGAVNLTATGCAGGSLNWYAAATGGTVIATGSTFTTSSLTATKTYYVSCQDGLCESGRDPAIATINAVPTTPTGNDANRCGTGTVTLTATGCTGGTYQWFAGPSGGAVLGSAASFTTPSLTATTTYYVSCKVGSCFSARDAAVATIKTPPTAPSVNDATVCSGTSATLTATGCTGTISWNTGATTATITVTPTATTTYTATCTVNGCTSSDAGVVTVKPKPTPSVNNATVCAGSSATLTVSSCTGGTISWNTGATTASITVTPTSTTAYTATCTVNGCKGTATGTVTVNPKPTITVGTQTCNTALTQVTIPVTVSAGATLTSGTGCTISGTSPNYTVTLAAGASCVVTAKGTNQCTVTRTITTQPCNCPTLTAPTAADKTICAGTTALLTASGCATGTTAKWYDDANLTTEIGSGNSFTTPVLTQNADYFVVCRSNTATQCKSPTGDVIVTVNPKPAPSVNDVSICAGESTALTVSNCTGGTVLWNTGATTPSITVTPTATTTYTATCTLNGCQGSDAGTVTVNPKPTPSVNDAAVCAGTSATLTVTNCSGTVSWNTGATTASITVTPTATTTYTATCTVNGCKGTDTGIVTVNEKPTPLVNDESICTGESATLTVTGCTGGTVSWNTGATTPSIIVNSTVTTTYTATCTINGCQASDAGTVSVNPKPTLTVGTTTCSVDFKTYSVLFTSNGNVTADKGTVSGNTVTGIPSGQTVTLTATLNGCTATATANKSCACPTVNPPVSGGNKTICVGETKPALTVTVDAGESANWYDTNGNLLASNTLTFTPTAAGTFAAEAYNTTTNCKSATRTNVIFTITPKPTLTIGAMTCSANLATYSIAFTSNGTVTADKGTVSGTTVSGIPSGQTVTLTATLNGCTATDTAQKDCNCPIIPLPTGSDKEYCSGTARPALTVTVGSGLTAEWYSVASGGTKLATGLSYTPTTSGTYYVEAVNSTTNCKSSTRLALQLTENGEPSLSLEGVCAPNGLIYNVTVTTDAETIQSDKGTVTGNTVTGIPAGQLATITVTSSKGCKAVEKIQKDCVCPTVNVPVSGGNKTICEGAAIPALTVTVGAGESANWFNAAGASVATNTLTYTPTVPGTYSVEAYNIASNCKSSTKTAVTLTINPKPTLTVGATTCAANLATYSVTFTGNGTVTADKGTVSGTTVSGIPSGQTVTLTATLNGCTATDTATKNCRTDCIKPTFTITNPPVCSANNATYSVGIQIVGKLGGTPKVNIGTLSGNNPYSVTGIPSGAILKITDSLSVVCKFDTTITGPNCNCTPKTPVVLTGSVTACAGDTFPTLSATVVGLATVEWFTQAVGGTAVATGLSYKPTGSVPTTGMVFYAQARSTDPTCSTAISTSRVQATVNAQDCTKEVDLALKKSINTKIAQIGDVLTYTLKVWNESNTNATRVEVTDSIATMVQFQTGSFTASRGSATMTGNVIKWTIGNIAANGDTVTLTYRVKATQEGVHFNTAEISKTNEKDIDSTPGNGKNTEDDIDRQCFTVPIKLCIGEKVQASVPASLTNVQWFKNGGTTAVASGNTVLLTEVGTYTFTATNQTCPANGCCPVIIEPGTNCCPEELCVPFTVKKRRK